MYTRKSHVSMCACVSVSVCVLLWLYVCVCDGYQYTGHIQYAFIQFYTYGTCNLICANTWHTAYI